MTVLSFKKEEAQNGFRKTGSDEKNIGKRQEFECTLGEKKCTDMVFSIEHY